MMRFRRICAALSASMFVLAGAACLSVAPGSQPTPPAQTTTVPAVPTTAAPKTAVSQPQPGATGIVFSGTVTYQGAPPPSGSSLYLALVKTATDPNQRACIDGARDPLDSSGAFRAQVACSPQAGDQLFYVLIIGPEGQRNWHSGAVPLPQDMSSIHIDVKG